MYRLCCGISSMTDNPCVAPIVLPFCRCYWCSRNNNLDLEVRIPMSAMLMHLHDIITSWSPRVFNNVIFENFIIELLILSYIHTSYSNMPGL